MLVPFLFQLHTAFINAYHLKNRRSAVPLAIVIFGTYEEINPDDPSIQLFLRPGYFVCLAFGQKYQPKPVVSD